MRVEVGTLHLLSFGMTLARGQHLLTLNVHHLKLPHEVLHRTLELFHILLHLNYGFARVNAAFANITIPPVVTLI